MLSLVVGWVLNIFVYVLLFRVILSWLRPRRGSTLERLEYYSWVITEPLLRPIRNALRPVQGGGQIDFSPLLLVLIISVVKEFAMRILISAGL